MGEGVEGRDRVKRVENGRSITHFPRKQRYGAPTYVHEQIKSSNTVSRLGKSKIADCRARVGENYIGRAARVCPNR